MWLWESLPEALSPCELLCYCCLLGSGALRLAGTQVKKGAARPNAGSSPNHWGSGRHNVERGSTLRSKGSLLLPNLHTSLLPTSAFQIMTNQNRCLFLQLSWKSPLLGRTVLSHTGRTQNKPHCVARCYRHTVTERDRKN